MIKRTLVAIVIWAILVSGIVLFLYYWYWSQSTELDYGYKNSGSAETYWVAKNEKVNTIQSWSTNFKP